MKQIRFVLLISTFNFSFLIFHSPRAARAALAPLFEPGGQACSRTADYQDRSSPGCYVTQGGSSIYNLYIPNPDGPRRGQDPNVSQTCFVITRAKTVTESPNYTPDYQIVKSLDPPLTFISTMKTEWPWDIPEETDYKKITLENPIAQFFADTFALQGTSRIPVKVNPQTIVDQYGPLEKLQPLLFQVKDRVDYCKLFESKKIFDETIHYALNGEVQSISLSQVCAAIPQALRQLTAIPETLTQWYQDDPAMALAFRRLTPYVQQDQVAWLVIYMYEQFFDPIDGPPRLLPRPTGRAIVKLNLAGLSRYTQAQQRLNDSLIPESLQSDTALPQGFPITQLTNLGQLEQHVLQVMKDLGYENEPQPCDISKNFDGEFQPGPPVTEKQRLLTSLKEFIFGRKTGFDAELGTVTVGRCSPQNWTKTFDADGHQTGWSCTAILQAVANVYLLNPTYLRDTCQDLYLDPTGYFRAHFPQSLIEPEDTNTTSPVPPAQEKPLLPFFHVLEANADPGPVSSPSRPNDPEGKVDLPTVCQGELVRAQSLALLGKALRPQEFVNQPQANIGKALYSAKVSAGFISRLTDFIRSLFSPDH